MVPALSADLAPDTESQGTFGMEALKDPHSSRRLRGGGLSDRQHSADTLTVSWTLQGRNELIEARGMFKQGRDGCIALCQHHSVVSIQAFKPVLLLTLLIACFHEPTRPATRFSKNPCFVALQRIYGSTVPQVDKDNVVLTQRCKCMANK
jgi:hypothetical protein